MAFRQSIRIKSSGFSLLEILIAMAIIAVMIGVAVPYIGQSGDKYARQEISRLLAAIEMVRDMAVIENREYGLTIDQKGYQFLWLNDEEDDKPASWELIEKLPALAEHQFPQEVEVNLAIDGENIFQSAEEAIDIFEEAVDIFEEEDEKPVVEPPKIYFLSTGEQNLFSIAVAAREDYQADADEPVFFRIQGNLGGQLVYQGPLPGNLFTDIERDYSDYLEQD